METDFTKLKEIFEAAGFTLDIGPDESDMILFKDTILYFSPTGELQDYDNSAEEKGYIV